ncbi:hypothetical protein [Achromobacter sp. DMS1]|nr:hypothetical protein [Achromobacter sp. DMS1]
MQKQMRELGWERALDTPGAMDREVRDDVKKWGEAIRAAGLKPE